MTAGHSVGDADAATPEAQGADAAWVSIETSLAATDLLAFLADVERLFRINPLLEFAAFGRLGSDRYRLKARNLSNDQDFDLAFVVHGEPDGLRIDYSGGLKSQTLIRVEAAPNGSRLIVSDHYEAVPEEERHQRLAEVDLSLNAWGRALHDYLRQWTRWRWLAPWRWYMTRVWQPMRPSARRIVYMIWIISLFELATLVVIGGLLMATGGIGTTGPFG